MNKQINRLSILFITSAFLVLSSAAVLACTPKPTPTPTPTPKVTPTPTPKPPCTPTPTQVPSVTPIPSTVPSVTPIPSGTPSVTPTTPPPAPPPPPPGPPPGCIASIITTIPVIISSSRINANTITLNWGPYAGLNNFVVRYGFTADNLQYNTKVTGFSATINSLPSNQQVFASVAATDNCAIGLFGPTVTIGTPAFPSTGYNPQNTMLDIGMISGTIIGAAAFLLALIKGKRLI